MAPAVKTPGKRRGRKLRIVLLVHEALLPPEDVSGMDAKEVALIRTELNVYEGLKALGHEVRLVGVYDELAPLRRALSEMQPDVVFNLLEEFHDQVIYDAHVVGYLELKGAAYTGCNPRGLVIARDKALSKKILAYHRIRVPRFAVMPRHRKPYRPKQLGFPLIVKSLVHEGSQGIAQASVVHNDDALSERVGFIHQSLSADAIVEQYIPGRELYVAVIGNHRLKVLPTWEIFLDALPDEAPKIATSRVKWDLDFQIKHNIRIARAENLPPEVERSVARQARRIVRTLGIDGYVRIDFRLSEDGLLYFLEANPNPDISYGEEFTSAAEAGGLDYEPLLSHLVSLGIRRKTQG